jgi:hypothetical protein
MDEATLISQLHQMRSRLAVLIAGTSLPQIEAILRSADMELHWALWNLGELVEHRPETERELS